LYAGTSIVGTATAAANGTYSITTDPLADGTYAMTVIASNAGGDSTASAALNVTIDTLRPTVSTPTFSFETGQKLQVGYSENVSMTLGVADLSLIRLPSTVLTSSELSLSYNATTNVASFTRPTGNWADGNYQMEVFASNVTDVAGNSPLSGASASFFILAADANRDRRVDTQDLNAVAGNYGGNGTTFSQGDFTSDGVIDSADFNILIGNYGQRLDAPAGSGTVSFAVANVASPQAASPFAANHRADQDLLKEML